MTDSGQAYQTDGSAIGQIVSSFVSRIFWYKDEGMVHCVSQAECSVPRPMVGVWYFMIGNANMVLYIKAKNLTGKV